MKIINQIIRIKNSIIYIVFLLTACYDPELEKIPIIDIYDNIDIDQSRLFEGNIYPRIDVHDSISFSTEQLHRAEKLKRFIKRIKNIKADAGQLYYDKSKRYEIYILSYEKNEDDSTIYYQFFYDTKLKKFILCETHEAF